MGALGTSVGPRGLDVPDWWHRHGFLLGLLRAWLGRLVVLGPGRKRFVHAVAGRHRIASFGSRDGKTLGAENLDRAACDPHFFAVAAWHIPCPLRCSDLGSQLRHRSGARSFYSGDPCNLHWRVAVAFRTSCAEPDGRRHLPPDFARRRARLQQSVSDDRCRNCADRYALPAAAGSDDRRQDFRRCTVLQHDVRSADDPASFCGSLRPAARLETR